MLTKQPEQPKTGQYTDADLDPTPGAPPPTGDQNEPSMLQKVGSFAGDVGKGLGQSAVGLMSTGDQFARKHLPAFLTNSNMGFGAPANLEHVKQMATPENTTQAVSKGIGDAAQFLIPGGAEEKAVSMLPKGLQALGKIGASGVASGLVNKAQGGSFSGGAAAGAIGKGAGMFAKAGAPTLTGIAQGLDAPYAKSGNAILEETKGLFPSSIRNSARGVLDKLNPELNKVAQDSPSLVPMQSARTAANEQISRAAEQNNPKMTKGITKMGKQLFEQEHAPALGAQGPSGKVPIPDEVPASQYLELKRGVGKALPAGSWSPESSNAFKGPRNAIYGTMGDQFEKSVPEAAPLNRRISALIPATEKPKNFFFGHALGPGVGATLGGVGGYRRGGLPEAAKGALEGAAAGFVAPTLMNAGARAAFSPTGQRLVPAATGGLLQLTRKDQQQ